ncbi:Uu.00g124270.m01.CDS01 [Anthostomella pinea]|uniref:Uu.00g124270.m01.CDS01 n=1 Tax=Anthostomella pinea TaxID=933095 RepID=A0AAI8VHH1_9PEZI|nr:Uu.00g124270.m01.CDS01 [Anthostomella pinea]
MKLQSVMDDFPVDDGWASAESSYQPECGSSSSSPGQHHDVTGASSAASAAAKNAADMPPAHATTTSVNHHHTHRHPNHDNNHNYNHNHNHLNTVRSGPLLIFPSWSKASVAPPAAGAGTGTTRSAVPPNGVSASSASCTMEYVKAPYRVATSPTAKRTYLGTALFLVTSLVLLGVASLAYPVFYYNYVPQKVIELPVHLQYGDGLNPYGVTSIPSNLMLEQAYDVSVTLTLPRSPPNLERGNFMIALFAMRSQPENPALAFHTEPPTNPYAHVTRDNVVFSARRPVLLHYIDPLVTTASRLLFLGWHVLFPVAERTATLVVPMGELVEFVDVLPLSLLVDVQAGQDLQVYGTSVTLVARLSGVRWAMYNHRVVSFVVCTAVFWVCEMASMGLAWLVLGWFFSDHRAEGLVEREQQQQDRLRAAGRAGDLDSGTGFVGSVAVGEKGGKGFGDIKREDFDDDEEEEEMKIKESMTEQETLVDQPLRHHAGAGDADDEEDGEDVWRESGAGSGYRDRDGKGDTSLRRRSSRGGKA